MRVVISNFSRPVDVRRDFGREWDRHVPLARPAARRTLFQQEVDWGFHLYALGVHLLDLGRAQEVEFWDFGEERSCEYLSNGLLNMVFSNEHDIAAYLSRTRPVDLYVNHGRWGESVHPLMDDSTFRVHVPTVRDIGDPVPEAECYLFDAEDQVDVERRSMVYVPVVHTEKIRPSRRPKEFDFIYLASVYAGKQHELLIDLVRGTELTGHLHPVAPGQVDVRGTNLTTSALSERPVVELLQSARIAVYPGDETSNPAAMWECVAAGLPIVVNAAIRGGKHLVVPGVTGELADADNFLETIRHVLAHRDSYSPREYFLDTWDTITWIERYLDFFASMGWRGWR